MFDELDNEESIKGIDTSGESFYNTHLPSGYLSISQVTQFLKCGEAYKRRYVDHQRIPASTSMVQGRGVHKAAEKLHLSMIDGAPISTEEMCAAYSDLYDTEIKEAVASPDEGNPAQVKDAGVNLTVHYRKGALGMLPSAETNTLYPAIKPIAAEKVFRVMLRPEESEPVPMVGVIDLEEATCIADLKTKQKAASQLEADNSLQLSLYSYITGKGVVRLEPSKTKPARYIRTESIRTRSEVKHMLTIVSEVAEDIVAGRFRKTDPDRWWCSEKTCAYWGTCRGKK